MGASVEKILFILESDSTETALNSSTDVIYTYAIDQIGHAPEEEV